MLKLTLKTEVGCVVDTVRVENATLVPGATFEVCVTVGPTSDALERLATAPVLGRRKPVVTSAPLL